MSQITFAHNAHNSQFISKEWNIAKQNKTVVGSFLMYKNGNVFIEDVNGNIANFPLTSLTTYDQNYILNKYSILNENTVSLHVRRGDYINKENYHPLQTIDYYKNAYDIINENSINVLILSDDVNWCKKNIKFNNISYIENETNIIDLYIMSLCKHNIIANSSFSWWGAWLNENKNKKVICPINWFGEKTNIYTGDITPEKWLKI